MKNNNFFVFVSTSLFDIVTTNKKYINKFKFNVFKFGIFMELKIYSVKDLIEPHDSRWYKTADYSFVDRILQDKFPGSKLIIVDDVKDIANEINKFLLQLDEKINKSREQYMNRHRMPDSTPKDESENLEHFSKLYEPRISIKTNVDGILFPARHADWNYDMDTMLENIGEPFKKGLDRRMTKFAESKHIYYPFSDVNLMDKYSTMFHVSKEELKKFMIEVFTPENYIHELNKAKGRYFYERFNIPVFETWKFLPGYRLENETIGKDEGEMKDRMHYVEYSYSKWLDRNFVEKNEADFIN
jgi:hypothetical protein